MSLSPDSSGRCLEYSTACPFWAHHVNLLNVLDAYPLSPYLGRNEHFDVLALRISFAVHELHDVGKIRLRVSYKDDIP